MIYLEVITIYNYFIEKLKGILPYQGFPRPFLSTKHTERSEGCLLNKIGRGIRWLSKTIISRKSSCTKVYRFLR